MDEATLMHMAGKPPVCKCCGGPTQHWNGLCTECNKAVDNFLRIRRQNLTRKERDKVAKWHKERDG